MSAAPAWQAMARHVPSGKTWVISGSPPDEEAARGFLGAYLAAIGQALRDQPDEEVVAEAEQRGRTRLGDLDFWVQPAGTGAAAGVTR